MITPQDAKQYISRQFDMGPKGYVELWREEGVFGVIAFSCIENKTTRMQIPTEWWGAHLGCLKIETTEVDCLRSLVHFFSTGEVGFKLPEAEVRDRFIAHAKAAIFSHHGTLMEKLEGRELNERFTFGFRSWGDRDQHHQNMRNWVRHLHTELNDKRVVLETTDDRLMVSYGW